MNKHILAIDPGASGGLVRLYASGKVDAQSMLDDSELVHFVRDLKQCQADNWVCYMELVSGYIGGPGNPGGAMFNFGDGYGYLRGLLAMAGIKLVLVRPQKWMKGIPGAIGAERADRKRALKEHAARLFPELKVTLLTADALCIAEYARQLESNGGPTSAQPTDFKSDAKAAKKWALKQGHEVPPRGSKDFLAMVNYFVKEIKPNL